MCIGVAAAIVRTFPSRFDSGSSAIFTRWGLPHLGRRRCSLHCTVTGQLCLKVVFFLLKENSALEWSGKCGFRGADEERGGFRGGEGVRTNCDEIIERADMCVYFCKTELYKESFFLFVTCGPRTP